MFFLHLEIRISSSLFKEFKGESRLTIQDSHLLMTLNLLNYDENHFIFLYINFYLFKMNNKNRCFHCNETIIHKHNHNNLEFCCNGCKIIYQIFIDNDLNKYYELENSPGFKPEKNYTKFNFLDNIEIKNKIILYEDKELINVRLLIPNIHCSSCIWVLENLDKLNDSILKSTVEFSKKKVTISLNKNKINLKILFELLFSIGYPPKISMLNYLNEKPKVDRTIYYKLGVSGFCFGNIMFLSFPEYFQMSGYWLDIYKPFFHTLIFFLSLPVIFYCSTDYFISSYKSIKSGFLNIDFPIALGIAVLFFRSSYDLFYSISPGFFDSLSGLVFFLLIGKFFQSKTYSYLSFDRDYKSYFPISVTKVLNNTNEKVIPIYKIKKDDKLAIRNNEIIPVDSILTSGNAVVNYSFVTGESKLINKSVGDKLFAGGKQIGGIIIIKSLNKVDQSYLTKLWNESSIQDNSTSFKNITDKISKYFTIVILLISFSSSLYWYFADNSKVLDVFTSVLIIACPCALALSAPFTLGNTIRIFSKLKFYLRDPVIIEKLAKIDHVVFDKTGTISFLSKNRIKYSGKKISSKDTVLISNILKSSIHPLSQLLFDHIGISEKIFCDNFQEIPGKGISAKINNKIIKIGSSIYVCGNDGKHNFNTEVYISINDKLYGKFIFKNKYRNGLKKLSFDLSENNNISVISGDNQGEYFNLKKIFPKITDIEFNQSPKDKFNYIKSLQTKSNVLMIGDGLNDAISLLQSDVGISLTENINSFTPASDAILHSSKISLLNDFLNFSKYAIKVIKASFVISFLYNIVGLSFAVSGSLSPITAAILMPLSSISIVFFTTILTNVKSLYLFNKK